jgi:hypothetical protein
MVDFVEAVKRPLRTDPVTIVLGVLFAILLPTRPLLHGLGLELSRRNMNGNAHMPQFDDFVDLFLSGLMVFVIVILYFLPTLIVLLVGAAASMGLVLNILQSLTVNPVLAIQSLMLLIVGGAVFGSLALVLSLLAAIMLPVGVQFFAHDKKIASAFAFRRIWSVVGTLQYWISWVLLMGYGIALLGVVALLSIPEFNALSVVFLGLAMYLWWMTWYIVMSDTVKESGALSNGRSHASHHMSHSSKKSGAKWKKKK